MNVPCKRLYARFRFPFHRYKVDLQIIILYLVQIIFCEIYSKLCNKGVDFATKWVYGLKDLMNIKCYIGTDKIEFNTSLSRLVLTLLNKEL